MESPPSSPPPDPGLEMSDESFVYMWQCRRPFNQLEDTDYSLLFDIRGIDNNNELRSARELGVLKYVDDFLGCEPLCTRNGFTIMTERKTQRFIHA